MIAAVVLASVASFSLRTITTYATVFTPAGINFQENDGWYHVRSAQNVAAHFPHRSGFDPYAIYPGGQPLVTGPLWDYMIATPAWILGGGSPSPRTVELVAAWLPPLLGAWFPLVVFFLTRFLFDDLAAVFAAWWIALIPGVLLWTSRLGGADHHTAESLFALIALGLAAKAAECRGTRSVTFTVVAGIALGGYFAIRPAGIFLVGILVVAALLESLPGSRLAPVSAGVLIVAGLLFLPLRGTIWAAETGTSLGCGIVATLALTAAARLWRIKQWSSRRLLGAKAAAIAGAIFCAWLVRPQLFAFLLFQFQRAAGLAGEVTVGELRPLLQSLPGTPWDILIAQFGTAWILALPALAAVIYFAWKTKRPALILFAVWSVVMAAGAVGQVRMAVYFCVNAGVLAGVASAWMARSSTYWMEYIPAQERWAGRLPAAIVVAVLAVNVPLSVRGLRAATYPNPEWRQALEWLRTQTPEPMGDAGAWTKLYPAREAGEAFPYPPQAYGVAVWWDFGYWVEYLARRMPSSNGTQAGAESTARFFTEIDPATALRELDQMGSRYILVDGLNSGGNPVGFFLNMLQWAGRPGPQYVQFFSGHVADPASAGGQVTLYSPSYYSSMAVRLYLSDAQPASAKAALWVIHAHPSAGQMLPVIDFSQKFSSPQGALDFMRGRPLRDYSVGGLDPGASCIPLDGVPGLRLAFSSSGRAPIKVFERVGRGPL
jgi:dolichyl-diphosphooligosaccharide--protein glycosyltransferase